MECLEAQSWPRDFLDEAVILFNNVVEVFHTQNLDPMVSPREFQSYIYPQKSAKIGSTLINHNPFRYTIFFDCALKEVPGGGFISLA